MHTTWRFAHYRPRLALAMLVGVLAASLAPNRLAPVPRLLIAWDVAIWTYLILISWLVFRADPRQAQEVAEQEDPSAAIVLTIMSLAAVLSVIAISVELAGAAQLPASRRFLHYVFTAITLLGSWLLLGMVFAIHYAHLYYRTPADARPLSFPGGRSRPDYWDFLYFSFTIAVAAQTSDVIVQSHSLRRVVLAQSVLSFFFNLAILGLSVNIAAGMLGQ